MPKSEGYVYGAQGDPNADPTFKPAGEPENRDHRASIEGSGVPGSPVSAGFPAEPDQSVSKEPIGGLAMEETIRRTTSEKSQDISNPGEPFEPGV